MKLAPVLLLLTSVGVLSLVTVGGAMPVAAPALTLTPPCTEAMVTAEITPRVRQHGHPKWVVKNIDDFEGEFVKLTGRMMLDTKHIPQAHRLPHERPNKRLKRATSWEVHPVTRFEVCTKTVSKCRRGLGWQVF